MTDRATIHVGDALAVLRTMPSESVHCCVTSPPYWGLRDYGVAGQIGLESSLSEFLAKLVAVFEEVRRVLRKDGTCWVNMGDAYAGADGGVQGKNGQRADRRFTAKTMAKHVPGLKAKDLIGQPWRLAFALQEAGWWLRSDIIWSKSNPMPESVNDRPGRSHEYLFLLTKSARYHYDADAVREPHQDVTNGNRFNGRGGKSSAEYNATKQKDRSDGLSRPPVTMTHRVYNPRGRHRRSVWRIACRPFRGAHFATYPPDLVHPCILAGCPMDGLVLDPFTGSGTTGLVALEHGRRFVGIELSPTYAEMARRRLDAVQTRIPGVA